MQLHHRRTGAVGRCGHRQARAALPRCSRVPPCQAVLRGLLFSDGAVVDRHTYLWNDLDEASSTSQRSSDLAEARPGVLRLMDEAAAAGVQVGICSTQVTESVLRATIGDTRIGNMKCLILGDPDDIECGPSAATYTQAVQDLGLLPGECCVVEDSAAGAQAALAAGCRCIVTYTSRNRDEAFPGAERIVTDLGSWPPIVTLDELKDRRIVQDDRIEMTVTDDGVYWHLPGK